MTTPGLRVDQVASAFVTVPGATVSILNKIPGAEYTWSDPGGDHWADINATIANTFVAPVAGTYQLTFDFSFWTKVSYVFGGVRLMFDAGTGSQQIIGPDDVSWQVHVPIISTHIYKSVSTSVALSAGSHTVKVQWKRTQGTGTLTCDSGDAFVVNGILATGSGAGGTIETAVSLPANFTVTKAITVTPILPADWADIPGMAISITTNGTETIKFSFEACVEPVVSGWTTYYIGLNIDGTVVRTWNESTYYSHEVNAEHLVVLPAGAHTIKIQAVKWSTNSDYYVFGESSPRGSKAILAATQYRGGLVPIKDDGASVIDSPAALNFTGPGVVVTNVNGVANVAVSGTSDIVSSVGGFVQMKEEYVASQTNIDSGTPKKIFDQDFTVPTTGSYAVQLRLQCWIKFITNGNRFHFDLVIDEGLPGVINLPGDNTWGYPVNTASVTNEQITFEGLAALTMGVHNIRVYGTRHSGTGASQIEFYPFADSEGPTRVKLQLIAGSGAGGVLINTATETANPTTISSATFADVPGLSTSISVAANETVLFMLTGSAYIGTTAFTAFVQWVDGSGNVLVAHPTCITGMQASSLYPQLPVNWTVPYTFPTAGTYTVKLQAKQGIGNWGLYDGAIQVLRFRGGINPPDSQLPKLSWKTISQIDLAPLVGTLERRTLQDGKQRYVIGTKTFDITLGAVDLGLDTGTETATAWYYLYEVPSTADDNVLTYRASLNAPSSGPTGYTNWRYIGAFKNASGDILKFSHANSNFYYVKHIEPSAVAGLTKTALCNPAQELSISDVVPLSAGAVFLNMFIQLGATTGTGVVLELQPGGDVDTSTTSGESTGLHAAAITTAVAWDIEESFTEMQTRGAAKTIGYRVYQVNGSSGLPTNHWVKASGWVDEYR